MAEPWSDGPTTPTRHHSITPLLRGRPLRIVRFNLGPLDNNAWLAVDPPTGQAAVIDPTFGSRTVLDVVRENGWTVAWVLNTHAHIDHVVENAWFVEQTGAPLALHPADLPLLHGMAAQAAWLGVEPPRVIEPTHLLADGEVVPIGGSALTVAFTPGHSPGHVAFLADGAAFTGDALFAGSIGRTDLPGGDHDTLLVSIRARLLTLPDATRVLPGHGPESAIGEERRSNPFL